MSIDWTALGQVFFVSLVMTIALVGLFTLGIVGASRRGGERADGTVTAGAASAPARVGAYLCFALCAAAVAYGIYMIVA